VAENYHLSKIRNPHRAYFPKDITFSPLGIEHITLCRPTPSQNTHTLGYTVTALTDGNFTGNNNHLLSDKVMQVKMSAHEIFIRNILYFLFRTANYLGAVLSVFPSCFFNITKIENN